MIAINVMNVWITYGSCFQDALTLQNLVHRTCKTLAMEEQDESTVPNVNEAVQEILNHVFIEMYNQQV